MPASRFGNHCEQAIEGAPGDVPSSMFGGLAVDDPKVGGLALHGNIAEADLISSL
jgi:hypothetical protein